MILYPFFIFHFSLIFLCPFFFPFLLSMPPFFFFPFHALFSFPFLLSIPTFFLAFSCPFFLPFLPLYAPFFLPFLCRFSSFFPFYALNFFSVFICPFFFICTFFFPFFNVPSAVRYCYKRGKLDTIGRYSNTCSGSIEENRVKKGKLSLRFYAVLHTLHTNMMTIFKSLELNRETYI